jgi:hypothetical protein
LYRTYAFDWDISLYRNPAVFKVENMGTEVVSPEEEAALLEAGLFVPLVVGIDGSSITIPFLVH